MCGGRSAPATPPPPPVVAQAPTPPAPSAGNLPDSQAYGTARRNRKRGQSIRSKLRIQLGQGGSSPVGTGINTNQ